MEIPSTVAEPTKDIAKAQAKAEDAEWAKKQIPDDVPEGEPFHYVFGKNIGSFPNPATRPKHTVSGRTNRVSWIHPLYWKNCMSNQQRLNEINKHRREKGLTPWLQIWSLCQA